MAITKEEEIKLFIAYNKGSIDAFHQLIQSQIPWAIKLASNYCKKHNWNDHDIAISGAQFGLMKAVKVFDHTKGIRLSTYCTYAILQGIGREHKLTKETIHIPYYLDRKIQKDNKYRQCILKRKGFMEENYGETLIVIDDDEYNIVCKNISKLSIREKYVLHQKYFEEKTLKDISTVLNVSRERVRQIQAKALGKLKWKQHIIC